MSPRRLNSLEFETNVEGDRVVHQPRLVVDGIELLVE